MDVCHERRSGKLCTTSNGNIIVWKGHACEGSNLAPPDDNFCLWTRCGRHDVPADAAHEGHAGEVTCVDCRELIEANE